MSEYTFDFAPEVAAAVVEVRKAWSGPEHVRRCHARPKPIRSVADPEKIAAYLERKRLAAMVVEPVEPRRMVFVPPPVERQVVFPPCDNETPTSEIVLPKPPRKPRPKRVPPRRPENAGLVGEFIRAHLASLFASM